MVVGLFFMGLYVGLDEVRNWLGVDSSTYDDAFLTSLIQMKMDYVDRLTLTTWNGNSKQVTEYHDLTRPKWGWWIYRLGFPIYLGKCWVRSIDSLEIYNGSEWEDWVALPQYLEGRDEAYWVDYQEGILYLNQFLIPQAGKEVKVTYTYGRDDLPGYVKELTLLLVVKDLLLNERRLFALAEGAQGATISEQIRYVDDRIKELEEFVRGVHIAKVSGW